MHILSEVFFKNSLSRFISATDSDLLYQTFHQHQRRRARLVLPVSQLSEYVTKLENGSRIQVLLQNELL